MTCAVWAQALLLACTSARLAAASLATKPCAHAPELLCVNLTVPLDHNATNADAAGLMLRVAFAVAPATNSTARLGTLAIVPDGPGKLSVLAASSTVSSLPASVRAAFDIVVWDQRGVGSTCGLSCPSAAAAFRSQTLKDGSQSQRTAALLAAEQFAANCTAEMGSASDNSSCLVDSEMTPQQQIAKFVMHATSAQTAEDLRSYMKLEGGDLWIYSAGYGSLVATEYLRANSSGVGGVVLDCPVDASIERAAFWTETIASASVAAKSAESWCSKSTECSADLSNDTTIDSLLSSLRTSEVTVKFPLPSGGQEKRSVTAYAVEIVAASLLSRPEGRAQLLRAVAAAAQGNYLPLARMQYIARGISVVDGYTLTDSTQFSDASHYSVLGSDYRYGSASNFLELMALHYGTSFSGLYLNELPAASLQQPTAPLTRPSALLVADVPVLVAVSDIDPKTPYTAGLRIFAGLSDGYLLSLHGGAHPLWGSNSECANSAIASFLLGNSSTRTAVCSTAIASNYVSLVSLSSSSHSSALSALKAFDKEIEALPEISLLGITGGDDINAGCSFGGSITGVAQSDGSVSLSLDECELLDDFAVSGTGSLSSTSFVLAATVTGSWSGTVSYTRNSTGAYVLSGSIVRELTNTWKWGILSVSIAGVLAIGGGTAAFFAYQSRRNYNTLPS